MNIGIFTETFLPQVNGVVVSICNTNKCLVKRGHKISVFTVGEGPKSIDGYKIYRFKGKTFRPYPEYKILTPNYKIWSTIKSKRFDVIHSRSPFSLGMIAKRFSQVTNTPIVGTFDTPITEYLHYVPLLGSFGPTRYFLDGFTKSYLRKYYGWCDLVTAPSETTKHQLLSMGFKSNIEVVSNGVDVEKYNPKNYSSQLKKNLCSNDEKLILHVGRITKEKRAKSLIKIAKNLDGHGQKFKMLIVGNGPELNVLKEMSHMLNLDKKIIFPGYISQQELPKYYASADIFLTASTVETQGIVLLEALSSGLPVIGADAGAIPELIKDGKNGFLFEEDNVCKASESVKRLLNDDNLRKKLSQNTRKFAIPHSIENVCTKMERIYRGLI